MSYIFWGVAGFIAGMGYGILFGETGWGLKPFPYWCGFVLMGICLCTLVYFCR